MSAVNINENMLSELRRTVVSGMSEKRAVHTLAAEKMAIRLGELYASDKINVLRAAALLHDTTKELKLQDQLELCDKYGIAVKKEEIYAPKTFHAKTAAAKIPIEFPDFADDDVISAVRWHTTGRKGMTVCEKIVYLADYIDESRTFDDCVFLRNKFWSADVEKMNTEERLAHLRDILILSYDLTIKILIEEKSPVASDTFDARNELICERLNANTLKG